jgi:phosphate uptake regulator
VDFCPETLPDDEIVKELLSIREGIEEAFQAASEVFTSLEPERALRLIREGREIAKESDALIGRIAGEKYDTATTTALVLATRYYKRIGGHLLNVVSSVVMPVHKVDYFDEDEILSQR